MKIHQIDTEVKILAEVMMETPIGAIVTYESMSKKIGRDVRIKDRHKILLAKQAALNDVGAAFETIHRIGYRRLPGNELTKIGQSASASIRKKGKKAIKTMVKSLASANDVAPEVFRKMLSQQSALGLIVELSRERNLPLMREEATAPLPYAVTAKMFLDAVNAR